MTARRDVPFKFARVIERAIDPRPERRYQSADALGADLAALKPRPRIVRLAYATGMAAASILVAGAGWEVVGRQVGVVEDAQRTACGVRRVALLSAPRTSARDDQAATAAITRIWKRTSCT